MMGVYLRYSSDAHREALQEIPELRPIIFRKTFEEASAAAKQAVYDAVDELGLGPGEWVHHAEGHGSSADPYNLVGSWGWRVK